METLTQATTTNPTTIAHIPDVVHTPTHQISEATYIAALSSAMLSSKYALAQEMSTCLSVFYEHGNVGREAKQTMMRLYAQSGFECSSPLENSYKTCSRRLNVGALLFTHLGNELIGKWCEGKMEMGVISSIVAGIEPYGFKSVESVLAFVGKPRTSPKAKLPIPVAAPTPEPEKVSVEPLTEERRVMREGMLGEGQHGPVQEHLFRRASDLVEAAPMEDSDALRYQEWLSTRGETPLQNRWEIEQGYHHVKTEHIAVAIPPETSREEILRCAMQLMALAAEMDGASTVGDLSRESVEELQEEVIEEDAAEVIRHQQQEIDRLEAEKKAAMAKPIAPAPSRFRKPTAKK